MRRRSLALTMVAAASTACVPVHPRTDADRIVSVDYCADQMLLGLVDRPRIAAVSVDVASDPDYSARLAGTLPRVRPEVERVLALRPTLVVRAYGGGPRFEAAMRRAGVRVFTIPYAATIDDIAPTLHASGEALGASRAAADRVSYLEQAVQQNRRPGQHLKTALYVTPGDVTTGPGSMIDDLFRRSGYANYVTRPGWSRLPVEALVGRPPDIVVHGFGETPAHRQDRWAASGHAVLDAALRSVPAISIPGSELACGNWRVGDAMRRLLAARQAQPR